MLTNSSFYNDSYDSGGGNYLYLQVRNCTWVMSLAVKLDTGEEIGGAEVGENVLDG